MSRFIIDEDAKNKILFEYKENNLSPGKIKEKLCLSASEYQIRECIKKQVGGEYSYKNKKKDVGELSSRVPKEEFINYYSNNSKEDTLEYFGLTNSEFISLKNLYNFEKSKEDILKVREKTAEKRYGVTNVFKADVVKQKSKDTCIEKYGCEYAVQSKDIKNKTKETIKDRYGSEENFYRLVREKSEATSLERYGEEYYSSTEECKNRIRKTNLDRYGYESVLQSQQIKEKAINTCQEKYGVPYSCMAKSIRAKIEKTCTERYGVKSPFESKEIRERAARSMTDKYGVDNPSKIDFVRDKLSTSSSKTNYDKWLSTYPEEYRNLYNDKDKSIEFLSTNDRMTFNELAERFSCSINSVIYWINKFNLNQYIKSEKSHYEDEIIQYIGEDICQRNTRSVLPGAEIDAYIKSFNLGIEFNGTYWHSNKNVEKDYHKKKSLLAEKNGIRLIHIYQYEWDNPEQQKKIKLLLDIALHRNSVKRIYARDCTVRQITNKEARQFNAKNHLQGHRNAQITYGLFYESTLVQLMSFTYDKKNEWWEIVRGCPGSNNIVVGGVGKLFKAFIVENHPKKIFSYCDFNKFDGTSYEKVGMKCIGYTGPDKKYVIRGNVYNRNPKKYKEYKENAEYIIWGAGSKKYLWESPEW